MKDINGENIKSKDILLEIGRGGGYSNGIHTYSLLLWEIDNVKSFNGNGYHYNILRERYPFTWAHPSSCIIVKKDYFPKNFYYSFYHGMSDLVTTSNSKDIFDLINNSDWKKRVVDRNSVKQYISRSKIVINSIEDIKNNITELRKDGYVPPELMYSILKVCNINKTNMDFGNFKGEIGLACFQDMINYEYIIRSIGVL